MVTFTSTLLVLLPVKTLSDVEFEAPFKTLLPLAALEHLSLCQAGCRVCIATGGQRSDGKGEKRHGFGQVRGFIGCNTCFGSLLQLAVMDL